MIRLIVILGLSIIPKAHASIIDDYCQILYSAAGCAGGGPGTGFIAILANRVIGFISNFIGAVAIAAFCWGGIKIITSAGNDEGRTQGLDIMKTAAIGIFLALTGNVILLFTEDFVQTAFP